MTAKKENNRIIFIVGVGRSGTTLLQSMLNANKLIAFPPETHFIRNYLATKKSIFSFSIMNGRNKHKSIVERIRKDVNLLSLNIDLDKIIQETNIDNKVDLKKFFLTLLKSYSEKKGKLFFGDKDPKNVEYLKLIKNNFPGSIILHIIRDPRDVILSRMKAEWSKKYPFILQGIIYREQLKIGENEGTNLFVSNYYRLYYEDLISYPEKTLKKICNFLNVDYDSEMLEFYKKSDEIVVEEERNWKENCFSPIMTSNMGKWKKELSINQIHIIEEICNEAFSKHGYKKFINSKNQKTNFLIFAFVKILALLLPLIDLAYLFYYHVKNRNF